MTKTKYYQELVTLVRSITLKSSHQSDMINYNITEQYGMKSLKPDYKTWRYYLNLNGQYHSTNEEMKILVLETNKLETLTKELLLKYKKTRIDLNKFDTTYKRLVAKHPTNELLIKGMLNPIDMETAYNAKDGTILSYSEEVADINDHSVMKKLSIYSQNMYFRWFNKEYIKMERYYVAVFLPFLYTNLIDKLDLLRLENIHTHKVHNFHLESFFESTLGLDTRYLNRKSKLWLYQNLRAVIVNNGQNETFREIMDNVITPNTIGVGKLTIKQSKPSILSESVNDVLKPYFTYGSTDLLISEKLNDYYDMDSISLSEVVSMAVGNGYIHETQYDTVNELLDRVKSGVEAGGDLESKTKVIHLSAKEIRDYVPHPRINVILDNLFYLLHKKEFEFDIEFADPNTTSSYSLSAKQAIRLLLYLMLKMCNRDDRVVTIHSMSIIKDSEGIDEGLLADTGLSSEYLDLLESRRPMMLAIYTNPDNLIEFIQETLEYFSMEWEIKCSILNQIATSNMTLYNRINNTDEFIIDIGDIKDEILLNETVDYNYLDSISKLLLALTKDTILLDVGSAMTDYIKSYVNLIKKTTSYNLQVLNTVESAETNHLYDLWFEPFSGPIKITAKGFFNALEDLQFDDSIRDMPTVDPIALQNNRYMNISDLDELVGKAIHNEYTLPEYKVSLNINEIDHHKHISVISGAESRLQSELHPMAGMATDETTMLRKMSMVERSIDGNAYTGGASYKLKIKEIKERNE